MYAVTAIASWSDAEAGRIAYHAAVETRDEAESLREDLCYPIVDVRNIGTAGHCPRPSLSSGGHAFDVPRHPTECSACGAWMDDLYVPGTYIPRERVIAA